MVLWKNLFYLERVFIKYAHIHFKTFIYALKITE